MRKTINGYAVVQETAIVIADSVGANVVYATGASINDNLSNKKFIVQATMTNVCAGDGALDIAIQGSFDGTTWIDLDASVGMDLDTTGLNTAIAVAVLTDFYAPYYRLRGFTDGTDVLDAGEVTLSYAFMPV